MVRDPPGRWDLLRLAVWDQLTLEDRQILLRFAKLLLEPRLTQSLTEVLRRQPDVFERDVQRAEERLRSPE
jgi:hypothetical protein